MRIPTLVLALCLAVLVRAGPIVQTTNGPVEGVITDTNKVWRGIPFAAPPVGNLRWMPPQPPQSWSEVKDATAFKPICPQAAIPGNLGYTNVSSEDCLYIQVYAPLNSKAGDNLPVYYYIYGGGYTAGFPGKYEGSYMAGQDVIVVVAAYRLGIFGFLASPLLRDRNTLNTTGNYAFQDQRLGLQWVKDNIANFGGNPNAVTIGGTSAGGGSVCFHLVSPRTAGLFHKVIIESGFCSNLPSDQTKAYTNGDAIITKLCGNVTDAQKITCLTTATTAQVQAAGTASSAVQDSYELMETPIALVRKGQFNRVPLIMGNQMNESGFTYCPMATPISEASWNASIQKAFPTNYEYILTQVYPLSDYPNAQSAQIAYLTDSQFVCPAKSFEDAYSAQAPGLLYVYSFNEYPFTNTPGPQPQSCWGASHTFNTYYLFPKYWLFGQDPSTRVWTPAEQVMSTKMRAAWVAFMKTGVPQIPDIPQWPTYNFTQGFYMNIDLQFWVGTHYKNKTCPAQNVPSAPTDCEQSIAVTQTDAGSWTAADGTYHQWNVAITTSQPLYSDQLIIRFDVTPFVGINGSISSFWGITQLADGLFSINDWRLQSGRAVPAGTTLNFGYISKNVLSQNPAFINVGVASCVAPPKDCHVSAALNLDGSYSDGQRFYQQYDLAFTNQGTAETDTVQVTLALPAGSFPSQAWNLQTSQSQADIIASGSVTYTAPVWGLNPGSSAQSSGFILSSAQANAAKPTFSVDSTTCL